MLKFRFNGTDGLMIETKTLTSGMVGKVVKLEFSSDWDGLQKTAVFTAGPTTKDVLNVGDEVVIPHEVLQNYGYRLYVGIYGVAGDGTITTTIYAKGPRILRGADPSGDESAEASPPVWAQLQAQIDDLKNGGTGGGSGSDSSQSTYQLPVATAETLGGVKPVAKTEGMTQPVGVDGSGGLFTAPGEAGGTDDYSALNNKPSINGVTLDGDKTTADLGIGNPTDEQVASAVSTWLDEHPEATTTVADGSITTEKLADNAVTVIKMDGAEAVANQILNPVDFKENGVTGYLDATGGIVAGGSAIPDSYTNYMTSPYMAVLPGAVYALNFSPYNMRCYDDNKVFVSAVTVETLKITNVTFYRAAIPEGAAFIRWCKKFDIADGSLETWMICESPHLYEEYFVGKKYVLNAESLHLKDGSLDGAALRDESVSFDAVTGCKALAQLFNQEEYLAFNAEIGYLINGTTGTATGGNNATYHASDFVAAKSNQVYTCNWMPYVSGKGEYGSVVCYDSLKAFIAKADLDENLRFTTPDGTAYIRFGDYSATTDEKSANYMICEGSELFSGYVPGGEKVVIEGLLLDKSTPANSVDGSILVKASIPRDRLAPPDGLKICCYGDSLTQNMYPAKVAALLGAEVVDAGVGGDTVNGIYKRVGNYGTDFGVVTLMCGTNDNGGVTSCPLGTVGDDAATDDNATASDTTYASRLKRLINKIKVTHPGVTYVLMPPFQHAWGVGTFNNVSTLMKQIAELYSIPFLDIYHLCGWRGTDEADKAIFMSDDTHENDVGAQRIAELLAGFIKQLKGF